MALTDAQAKIIAANKKKKEEQEAAARKLAAAQLANAAKNNQTLPVVTPSRVVSNQVQTPLKSGKPVVNRTTTSTSAPKRTTGSTVLSDYARSNLLERMTDSRGQLYTPLDIVRYRASKGESAASLATQARTYDNDDWQDNLRRAAEERVARREKLDSYALSKADSKLPSVRRQMVQEAKDAWQKAKDEGDLEGMRRAHEKAENVRGWAGYSGGSAGDEYITADLTWDEKRTLNQAGQNKLKKAKLDRQKAWEEKDAKGVQDATRAMAEIMSAVGYRANPSDVERPTDAYGRPMMTGEERLQDAARAVAGVKSVGTGVAGSLLSLAETGNQAMRNYTRDRWGHVLEANANQYEDPLLAQKARARLGESTIVDPNLPGQTLMRKSQEYAQEALDGTSGAGKFLGETIISLGQNLPGIAISMIPGAQAAGLALLGVQAAGSKAWELNEQSDQAFLRSLMEGGSPEDYGSVSPGESLLRGILSGGVEILTEKIPLDNLRDILMGKAGQNAMKNILTQMGMEATEEGAAYSANFVLDKIAQDPNAEWTMEEFLRNAAMGAVSGGALATAGSIAGSRNDTSATPSPAAEERTVQSIMERQAEQPSEEQQARDMAAAMLTGEEYVAPLGDQEQAPQKAAEAPVEAPRRAEATIPAETRSAQPAKASEAVVAPVAQKAQPTAKSKQVKLRRIESIPVEVETVQAKRQTQPVVSPTYIADMSSTLGESGAKVMNAAWSGQGNQAQYAADFVRVYNQALTGASTGRILAPDSLSDAQVAAAYNAGVNDRRVSLEEAKTAAQYATVAGKDSGLVYDDYVKAEMDTTVASEINTVAKQLGLRVQMVDSVKGGDANADIQGSAVSIEKGNPNPVRTLFGHEMTHRVQELAPESYREFRDYVMQDQANQAEVQRRIRLYASKGVNLTAEQAMDEIVADHAGALIESKDLMKRFIDQNRKNHSLLGRMLTALKDMAAKLTGRRKAQVNDAVSLLEKAVGEASKQAKLLEKNKNTAKEGGVRYSINEKFPSLFDAWYADRDKNGNLKTGGYILVGTTSDALQSIGVKDYSIYWDKSKIASVMKKHPEMTPDVIKSVPDILEHPILVMQSVTVANRITVYGEVVAADGNPVRVAMELRPQNKRGEIMDFAKVATAHGRHSAQVDINNSEILYVDPNKKRTEAWLEALRLQLPSGLTKYGPIGTVTYVNRDVNGNVSFGPGETKTAMQAAFEKAGISYDETTESASPTRYSLKTWNASSYVQDRDKAAKEMADKLGVSQKKAKQYIDDVNSIARLIADDRVRLDYEPSPGRSAFVSNAEYGGSIDFSTICKKRRLFTGTFEAIQEALPNTALTAEEFLEIRSMMAKKDYEVSCGLCYVEGSRANMGQYTKQFIERYAATNPDYVPNMSEMNTASGQEKIRREHPEVYEAYEYFMNHYGRLKPSDKALFASQQKPKMYQMATEYQGEVLTKFGKKNARVDEKNANGGLRLQSFSDFEIIHLIDSMQVIMDMSRVGLAGQAYTKVPDFAWALGDTGLKINLSLIAKGVKNGKLVLDEVEGMAEADAMALRERYSDNVGTILVVFNDAQLRAAMEDNRIDFIIPFHRSQWKTDQYEAMGLPKNAKDFTPWQNESYIEPVYNKSGKKQRPENYMPNNYWDFRKSGKKNAEAYLKMCAENNRKPKFHYLLDKKADGSYALKKDGSTDGYWKLLIDFKMYNNEGKGVPQRPVKPNFNMEQAERMLTEYTGGHSKFPAAQDVVDEFVAKYKKRNPGVRYSLKTDSDGRKLTEAQVEFFSDSQVVDGDGNLLTVYHGTKSPGFTQFDTWEGAWVSPNREYAEAYAAEGSQPYELYANITKPAELGELNVPLDEEVGRRLASAIGVSYSALRKDVSRLSGRFAYELTKGRYFVKLARQKGFDGFKATEAGVETWAVFSPEQLKEVGNTNPTGSGDIRYSLKGEADFQELISKYGAIPQGENPRARDIQVPQQTGDNKKVSRTVRTILESGSTTDEMVPTIQEMVANGDFSYEVASDKAAIETAEATIRDKGFQASLMDWIGSVSKGEVNKQNVATGWALYDAAAQAGDAKTAADIMTRIVIHQRNAAQAVQATRILKKMSPSAQLYGIQRSVQNMQEELTAKYGDKAPDLKVPDELIERFLDAESDEARLDAEIEIYRNIGKQMPSTFIDKWNAWRYLAMLGNFRTHIRNTAGNLVFAPFVAAKNVVGIGLEGIGSVASGGKMQRTKGVATPSLLAAGWNDYQNAVDQIMAGGKWDDSAYKRDAIEEGRQIFRFKPLEFLRRLNSWALQKEDGWFAQPHYANALAQYCAANGITAEQIRTREGVDASALDKARAYAIKEAQKATYRDFNQFSDFIGTLGRYDGNNKVRKAFSAAVEGVLPFRKTPANILVRALEYSPVGLIQGTVQLAVGVPRKMNTAAEALDHLASGLTGTGLVAAGYFLAKMGLLTAGADDDEEQAKFDDLTGKQEYAWMRKDGTNFTLDWLAPECIPLLVGADIFAAIAEETDEEEKRISAFLGAMSQITDPLLEMSCLSSLNELFDNLNQFSEDGIQAGPVVVANMVVSYLTQGIPTLLGQGERASEVDRMTTYTDKNGELPTDWQYVIGRASARIPKWDYNQIPYIDAWGRTDREESQGKRILDNFFNPAFSSEFGLDNVETELERLYGIVGEDSKVYPSRADRYFNVNGARVDLTADQYVEYAQRKGQRSYELVQSVVSSPWYASASDAVKGEIITNAYTIANEEAKKALFPEYESKSYVYLDAQAAVEAKIPVVDYLYARTLTSGVASLKDANGETITLTQDLQQADALLNSGIDLSGEKRNAMFDIVGIGKTVKGYSASQIASELASKRSQAVEQ